MKPEGKMTSLYCVGGNCIEGNLQYRVIEEMTKKAETPFFGLSTFQGTHNGSVIAVIVDPKQSCCNVLTDQGLLIERFSLKKSD